MKQILCLVAVFLLLAGAKSQDSVWGKSKTNTPPAQAKTATPASPMGDIVIPDAGLMDALSNPNSLPDKATLDLLSNPAFVNLMSGTPEEVKARLDAITNAANAAPMMTSGAMPGTTAESKKNR